VNRRKPTQFTLTMLLGLVLFAAFGFGYVRWMGTSGVLLLLTISVWGGISLLLFWIMNRVAEEPENRQGELVLNSWLLSLIITIPVMVTILILID